MWDPQTYLAFDDHRRRPFVDLLGRVGAERPRRVVDLGCGPGHLTELLGRRWPGATLEAVDSSPAMAEARSRGVAAEQGDLRDWVPAPGTEVLVCNAVLQWVPGHAALLDRWLHALPEGAWLAMQVPGNFAAPSHTVVRDLAAEPRWRDRVSLRGEDAVADPADYAELMTAAGAEVDAWETTYLHRLTGPDPVLRWISGTALRPVRAALPDEEWDAFRVELAPRLRAAYPASGEATWFPFRRVFAVARLPA